VVRNLGKVGGFDGFLDIEQDGLLPGSKTVFACRNDHETGSNEYENGAL